MERKRGRAKEAKTIKADLLKEALKERGLSQLKLCESIHYDKDAFNKALRKGEMNDKYIKEIAEYLNVSYQYLRGLDDEKLSFQEGMLKEYSLLFPYGDKAPKEAWPKYFRFQSLLDYLHHTAFVDPDNPENIRAFSFNKIFSDSEKRDGDKYKFINDLNTFIQLWLKNNGYFEGEYIEPSEFESKFTFELFEVKHGKENL